MLYSFMCGNGNCYVSLHAEQVLSGAKTLYETCGLDNPAILREMEFTEKNIFLDFSRMEYIHEDGTFVTVER